MTEAEEQELRDRVRVLERTLEIMAGYINGFGIIGLDRARRSAVQQVMQIRAATERPALNDDRMPDGTLWLGRG